jgi:hypothetical protein
MTKILLDSEYFKKIINVAIKFDVHCRGKKFISDISIYKKIKR